MAKFNRQVKSLWRRIISTGFFAKRKSITKFNYYHRKNLHNVSKLDEQGLLAYFNSKHFGLTNELAQKKIKTHGLNIITKTKFKWWKVILELLISPFNIILLLIGTYNIISYFVIDQNHVIFDLIGAAIVFLMVFLGFIISFTQSLKTYLATKKILKSKSNSSQIIRVNSENKIREVTKDNYWKLAQSAIKIDNSKIMPGDLIYLSGGSVLPCDARLIYTNNCQINQSMLSGESQPVQKFGEPINIDFNDNVSDYTNLALAGTTVSSGSAIAIAVATAKNTYLASIAKAISQQRPKTSFTIGIRKIILFMVMFMLIMVPIVLIIRGVKTDDWVNAVVFAAAVTIGIAPELLPVIITSNLSRSAQKLEKKKILTKHLEALQNIGSIDILCSDKTGTLTEDQIKLVDFKTFDNKQPSKLIEYLYVNSKYQMGHNNVIDNAIIEYTTKNYTNISNNVGTRFDEIPFDFERRMLSVIVEEKDHKVLTCKGALREVLESCDKIQLDNKIVPLTGELRKKILRKDKTFLTNGYRTIALAYRYFESNKVNYTKEDEIHLIFLGFGILFDAPKASAKQMIKLLKKRGVDFKILTGDNEYSSQAICDKVGFKVKSKIMTGEMLDELSPYQYKKHLQTCNVFTRLSPLQKAKIIDTLKILGHRIGFIGDGINDAISLKRSDVSISVSNASEIAKEASDLILQDKTLTLIDNCIYYGRRAFGNILKYVKISLANNLGNVCSILIASIWLPWTPMLPIQILLLNFFSDLSQIATITDNIDEDFYERPRPWSTKNLAYFMIVNGLVSSVFDMIMFAILSYGYGIYENQSVQNITMFHTTWFTMSAGTQALVFLVLRTKNFNIFKTKPSWQLVASMIVFVGLGFAVGTIPQNDALQMHILPGEIYGIIFALMFGYIFLANIAKYIYTKIFKSWI